MLDYTDHAKERMRQRRISREEVEQVHANHHTEKPGNTEKQLNFWGETAVGRRLRITVEKARMDSPASSRSARAWLVRKARLTRLTSAMSTEAER